MIALVKTTQESQIKSELYLNKLQESVDFISAKFDENKKDKKQKEEKLKYLEGNNFKLYDKIAISRKKLINKNSNRDVPVFSCMLYKKESTDEVTDDIAAKTICKNINDNIITVDDIVKSHRIGKYDPQKKHPGPVIVEFARYNVRERVFFSNKHKLKVKQIKISESLARLRLMNLKEASDQYTFANIRTQYGKILFEDDNKGEVYFD